MRAFETAGTINESGQLILDRALEVIKPQRVRVIVLMTDDKFDPEETPTEVVIQGIQQGLSEALAGKTIPLSEMWVGIDAECSN